MSEGPFRAWRPPHENQRRQVSSSVRYHNPESCDEANAKHSSFCQEYSLAPLMCPKEAILTVLRSWQISSMFVDVLLKFGDQPQIFQESSGFRQSLQSVDQSFGMSF